MKTNQYFVSTFYQFSPLENVEGIKSELLSQAQKHNIKGLIILSHEGLNATVSSVSDVGLLEFKKFVGTLFPTCELFFKDSVSDKVPFLRFSVKIREEIVTLGTPELVPNKTKNQHLSPQEWNEVLKNENDYVLIDTRNWYETKIGTFKGAINPKTNYFTEFPKFLKEQNIPKEKKMLIFCTGGIRCERGILELQRQGYENVFQLEGGILNYLKEAPNDQFEGECFVFDLRVAVDQKLQPTKTYSLCPHCGQPAATPLTCKRCDHVTQICEDCSALEFKKDTCSKNCSYQMALHPERKGKHQWVKWQNPNS